MEQTDGSPPPSWLGFKFPNESASGNIEISGISPEEDYKGYNFFLYVRDVDNMVGKAPFYIQTQGKEAIKILNLF